MARDKLRAMAHVRPVEISYTVIREAGPCSYCLRPRLVAQEPERKIETQPLAAVAIVRDTHITLPVYWFVLIAVSGKISCKATALNSMFCAQMQDHYPEGPLNNNVTKCVRAEPAAGNSCRK